MREGRKLSTASGGQLLPVAEANLRHNAAGWLRGEIGGKRCPVEMGEDTERTEGGDQARPFTLPVEGGHRNRRVRH